MTAPIIKIVIAIIVMITVLLSVSMITKTSTVKEVIINNTIYENQTVYITNHTIKEINVTIPCPPPKIIEPDKEYTLSLIRQIKRCESQLFRNFTLSEYHYKIEKLNKTLQQCNETLNEINGLIT